MSLKRVVALLFTVAALALAAWLLHDLAKSTTVALAPPGTGTAGVDTGVRFTTQDAGADHASLSERGVDVDPEVMRWPGVPAMFSLRDPDGNTLYIVEDLGE